MANYSIFCPKCCHERIYPQLDILSDRYDINRYVHAYFNDNDEVMMELEDIDLMFSNQDVKPMPIKDYREYMEKRKKEAKDKAKTGKGK